MINASFPGMSEHTYKKVEIIGSSPKSIEDAVENALEKADESIRNMRWFEVSEIRGSIDDDEVSEWQVGLKLGFTLEAKDAPETLREQGQENAEPAGAVPQNKPFK